MIMAKFIKSVTTVLKQFHHDIGGGACRIGPGITSLAMLSNQISIYTQIIGDSVVATTRDIVLPKQKDINRAFTPVIGAAMQPSYAWCSDEVGHGQFMRMKSSMKERIRQASQSMFRESANEVKRQLTDLVHEVEETRADKIDEVFIQIQRDYRSVLGGSDASQGEVIPRVQGQVRKEIKQTIDGVERMMKQVIGLEVEDTPAPEDEVEEAASAEEDSRSIKAEDGDPPGPTHGAEVEEASSKSEDSNSVKAECSDTGP